MSQSGFQLPLPWLAEPLKQALRTRRAHALLIQGPRGVGQFELALALAQAWLCDSADEPSAQAPCGICGSCKLMRAHSHPDLMVLLPEALRESLGWSQDGQGDDGAVERSSKTKPSNEIKVEAVRAVVAFAQTTSARGRGKVAVIHPAERMNAIAANTLLKTLEEPPGDARFVLSCSAPDALLPTIRSRCQALPLMMPGKALAVQWLRDKGVEGAEVLLQAAGGQPLEALEWAEQGMTADLWLQVPEIVARGDAALLSSLPLPRLVNVLQKVCHDALCSAFDTMPRFFAAPPVVRRFDLRAVSDWAQALALAAQHVEHPWHANLMAESLVQLGQRALSAPVAAHHARVGV